MARCEFLESAKALAVQKGLDASQIVCPGSGCAGDLDSCSLLDLGQNAIDQIIAQNTTTAITDGLGAQEIYGQVELSGRVNGTDWI